MAVYSSGLQARFLFVILEDTPPSRFYTPADGTSAHGQDPVIPTLIDPHSAINPIEG